MSPEDVTPAQTPDRVLDALLWAEDWSRRDPPATDGPALVLPDGLVRPTHEEFRTAAKRFPRDVRRFVDAILMSRDAEAGLDALLACGALGSILPEVEAMVGFGDGEWRHKDVWKHTKQVVRQAVPRLEVRWAALLHDIGKVKTRSISPDGEVHFFGHAEVGAKMFDKINRRVPLFHEERALEERVRFLVLHHLRASQFDGTWTDSAVRRFAKEVGDALDDLLCLSRADITTKRPEKKKKGLRQISDLAERVAEVKALDSVVPALPSGLGDAICLAFGIPPSRRIGDVKRALEEAVEKGELAPNLQAEEYLAFLREHATRFGL